MSEGGRQETQQSEDFIRCDVCITVSASDFFFALYSYMFGSQQAAGWKSYTAEYGSSFHDRC